MFDYNLGKHCCDPYCHQKDFLPYHCDVCNQVYCSDHRLDHTCDGLRELDMQSTVPTCPICSHIVPKRFPTENNDIVIYRHMESGQCIKSDTSKSLVIKNTDSCHVKSCKSHHRNKRIMMMDNEVSISPCHDMTMFIQCNLCNKKHCMDHRVPEDHECEHLKYRIINNNRVSTVDTVQSSSLTGQLHLQRMALRNKKQKEKLQPSDNSSLSSPSSLSVISKRLIQPQKRSSNRTESIQFVNTPKSAVMPTTVHHRTNLNREDQLHVPVFFPMGNDKNNLQPVYMYFPIMSSIGKIVDMVCSWANLGLIDKKTGYRLRVFSMISGNVLTMSSRLEQLVKDELLFDGSPILFEYASDDTTMIREETMNEIRRNMSGLTRQTLARKCGVLGLKSERKQISVRS